MEWAPSAGWLGIAAGALALVWLGARLADALRARQARRAGRFHNERGQRGEQAAEHLLKALGYRIAARQARGRYALEIDGDRGEVDLVADLLVERDGVRLVAEVKTGKWGRRVGQADTRRQLLEYQLAFDVNAVLLVDVETGRVREVRFPWSSIPAREPRTWPGGVRLALALLLVALSLGVCARAARVQGAATAVGNTAAPSGALAPSWVCSRGVPRASTVCSRADPRASTGAAGTAAGAGALGTPASPEAAAGGGRACQACRIGGHGGAATGTRVPLGLGTTAVPSGR
jgi:Holliday junction resolvase-like predicted endonuclease